MNLVLAGVALACLTAAWALAEGAQELTAGAAERLAGGFQFTEGPLWMPQGMLVFSDIPGDTIYSLKDGRAEVFRRPSGNSNGLALDGEGRLIACEHGTRRVSRTEKDGTVMPLATHYEGKRLNSPNDVVVKSDGAVYFTDPPYGVRPENRELSIQGVYRVAPDGRLTLLVDDFVKPNGLAFTPDEKVLYIADTEKDWVRAFDVREDGTVANGRVFYRVEPPGQLRPDGMKVDVAGNLYIAGSDGVAIVGPDGRLIQTVRLPERPSNLAFGGPDGRALFVTARQFVYRIPMKNAGAVVRRRLIARP
jgi:gluconolactonase